MRPGGLGLSIRASIVAVALGIATATSAWAEGRKGQTAPDYMDPAALTKWEADKSAAPRAYLMDPAGTVGRAYGAKTTPHMYVIDPAGKLVYAGGIDDKRSTNVDDVKTARNYVKAALDETLAGRPVSTSTATPYGCSVKYAS